MKAIKILIFLTVIFVTRSFAQVEYDYSGYLLNLPIYQYKNHDVSATSFNSGLKIDNFTNQTRFRFRPVFYLWENARINIEYETNITYRNKNDMAFSLTEFNKPNTQFLNLYWSPVNEKHFTISHFIDRLYFRLGFDWGNVIIGRQRIAWGTGRVWNPTDLFNPINPVNFTKIEKDGADAITSKIIFGEFTDLQLVFNPNELIKKSNYAFRFRSNYKEYDISLLAGSVNNRTITGFDFAGNFFSAGLRAELLYSISKTNSEKNFVKYIIGLDYQLTSKLYALLEYHYNGEGKLNSFDYEIYRLFRGEVLNLSRNYLAISSSYEFSPLFKGTMSGNFNLNDSSGYISLDGNYSLDDDVYISLAVQTTFGNTLSEYYLFPHSFYFRMEYFF